CNRLVMTPPVQVVAPSRSFLRPHSASCSCLPEIAEDVGPVLLEVSIALQSTLQHGSYAPLRFGPRQRCSERGEGVQELVGGWQGDLVDEFLRRRDGTPVEGGDPARERVDETVQLGLG